MAGLNAESHARLKRSAARDVEAVSGSRRPSKEAAIAATSPKIFVGPTTSAEDLDGYQKLIYTAVSGARWLGDVHTGRLVLEMDRDALDPGQVALRAADKTRFSYAFKLLAAEDGCAYSLTTTWFFHATIRARLLTSRDGGIAQQLFDLEISSTTLHGIRDVVLRSEPLAKLDLKETTRLHEIMAALRKLDHEGGANG